MTNIISASSGMATIVAKAALGRLASNLMLARLINRDFENEVRTHGRKVSIQKRGVVSVNDKAGGSPYTLQAVADTAVEVTLDQHPEVSFLIEDYDYALSRPDVLQGYMDDAILALCDRVEGDIAALRSGFSQSVIATGSSGPLDKADFIEARRLLTVAKAPPTNRFAVLHPTAAAEAFGISELANRDYRAANETGALATGALPPFLGFQLYESQNVVESSSKQYNLFGHRDMATLVMRPLPAPKTDGGVDYAIVEQDGIVIRVMLSYSHKDGGHLVTVDTLYGLSELRDAFGVAVITD